MWKCCMSVILSFPTLKVNKTRASVRPAAPVSIRNAAVLLPTKHALGHVSMFSAIQKTVENVEILYVSITIATFYIHVRMLI